MLDQTKIYNKQFIVRKRISAGSFGVVYSGYDLQSREYVAIKIEQDNEVMSLEREEEILRKLQGVPQVPKLLWVGKDKGCSIMVQQLLGRDLQHFLRYKQQFSLQCIVIIAEQLLSILENIHNKGIVHRDIKPENIVYDNNSQLYLIDYGISKIFRNGDDKHMNFKDGKPFLGTSRYASISAHKGFELSRKDDLESLAYVLIYLFKGSLPWQSLGYGNEDEKLKKVQKLKTKITSSELCKEMPIEFSRFLDLVKTLKFKDRPDYKYYQFLFNKVRETYRLQRQFDWSNERRKVRSTTIENNYLSNQKPKPDIIEKQIIVDDLKKLQKETEIPLLKQRRITQISPQDESRSMIAPGIRHRSTTASCNSSNYSDVKQDPSVMIGNPMMIKLSTFCGDSSQQNMTPKISGNFLVHKFSLEMMNNYKNASLLELQLEMNHKEGVAEQQLNEDENPSLDNKLNYLTLNSVQMYILSQFLLDLLRIHYSCQNVNNQAKSEKIFIYQFILLMDEYMDLSRVQEESRQSIDSQELLKQVERKIQQSSPIKFSNVKSQIKKRDQYNFLSDDYDQKEKIEYLSFKEQAMVKRLLELRDDHKIFLKNLSSYEEQLAESIKDLLHRVIEQCNIKLSEAEKEIRCQLQEIQKNKQLLNQNSNSKIKQSPVQSKATYYEQMNKQLNELIQTIKNYDLFELSDEKTIHSNKFFGKLNFSISKDSGLNYTASKSPLKELDRLLQFKSSGNKRVQAQQNNAPQDLNHFIEILKNKLANQKYEQNYYHFTQPKNDFSIDKWATGQAQQTQRNLILSFEKQNQSRIQSPIKSYAIDQALSKQSKEFFKLRR